MTLRTKIGLVAALVVGLGVTGFLLYAKFVSNPRVVLELQSDPNGVRAQRVMLLTLANGKVIPVNYLRDAQHVFVGADGPWWRNFRDGGGAVTLMIRGRTLSGRAVAVTDDPAYTREIFSRLRPSAPKWLPDWLNGVLVVVTLDADAAAEG